MLRIGEYLSCGLHSSEALTFINFSVPEDEFVWSNGRWAEMQFDIDTQKNFKPNAGLQFEIDLDVFKFPPSLIGQNVLIYLNGLRVKSAYISDRVTLRFSLSAVPLMQRQNVLTFDMPDAQVPEEFGVPDDRRLGVQVYSVGLSNIS